MAPFSGRSPSSGPFMQPATLKGDEHALTIEWRDGVKHRIPWSLLRKACPCATCRIERQKPAPPEDDDLLPVISPAEAGPIRGNAMRAVGNYAYGVNFSDGHNTGIYSLDLLRQLGEEVAKRGGDL